MLLLPVSDALHINGTTCSGMLPRDKQFTHLISADIAFFAWSGPLLLMACSKCSGYINLKVHKIFPLGMILIVRILWIQITEKTVSPYLVNLQFREWALLGVGF